MSLGLKSKIGILPDLEIYQSETGKDPDQRNYLVSNEKIEQKGFKPKVSIKDGINELIRGLKNEIFTHNG